MALLSVENLNFAYAGHSQTVLKDISFRVERGEFILVCGPSGSGKTTLLRHIKPRLEPVGTKSGCVKYYGKELDRWPERETAAKIGMILQNPENQIVAQTVRHELAFGLECIGTPPNTILKRVAETVSYFGIEHLYNKKTSELSGGEKQIVATASIMTMRPDLLLLDEPASQLDPIAARSLYDLLVRMNNELGITIIMTEHRLDDIFPIARRVMLMDNGKLLCDNTPEKTAAYIGESENETLKDLLPAAPRIYLEVSKLIPQKPDDVNKENNVSLPIMTRQVKPWFENAAAKYLDLTGIKEKQPKRDDGLSKSACVKKGEDKIIELKELHFKFEKQGENVIDNLSLDLNRGEFLSIVGGNGAGKTTLLRLISGILKPYSGSVKKSYPGLKISFLPQNPQSLFAHDRVIDDLKFVDDFIRSAPAVKIKKSRKSKLHNRPVTENGNLDKLMEKLEIGGIIEKHPYDLSAGEMQRAAVAMLLIINPDVLLLDEPTKGLDKHSKKNLAELLTALCKEGVCVVTVTHDIEFAAEYSDCCAMLFDGKILSKEPPRSLFSDNMCYTTVAHLVADRVFEEAVNVRDVLNEWKVHSVKN